MSLVPNRIPRALGKALAGKKMPAGTRLGTAALIALVIDFSGVFFWLMSSGWTLYQSDNVKQFVP